MTDETWNLEAVYDEQIAPLMTKVIAICKEHQMPMVASFAYAKNDDTGETSFCTTSLPFGERQPDALREAVSALYRRRSGLVALTIQGSASSREGGETGGRERGR